MDDLHFEHNAIPKDQTDSWVRKIKDTWRDSAERRVLVLAGDIIQANYLTGKFQGTEKLFSYFLIEMRKAFDDVVAISGNHEHWQSDFLQTHSIMREYYERHRVVYLERGMHFIIPNVAIFGATLWTDYQRNNHLTMRIIHQKMNDYDHILDGESRLFPSRVYQYHMDTRADLEQFLARPYHRKIVVTHHAPSERCLLPEHKQKDDGCNEAYYSMMDDLLDKAHLWLGGHLHSPMKFTTDSGAIYARNPRGYPHEKKWIDFDPTRFISVPM